MSYTRGGDGRQLRSVADDIPSESKMQNTWFLPITSANIDRFSKFFHHQTQQWSCVTDRLLTILLHLKRVATLPCETSVFKIDWLSTLINTVTDCLPRAYKQYYSYLQTSGVIWLYTLQHHSISFDRYCWLLPLPRAVSTLTFCASSAASSQKVQ